MSQMQSEPTMAAEIRELLDEGRLSTQEIAEWLGCTPGYVAQVKLLVKKKHQLNSSGLSKLEKRKATKKLIKKGLSNGQIAERVGCHIDLPARIRRELSSGKS